MSLVTEKTRREKELSHYSFQVTKNGKIVVTHTLLVNPGDFSQEEAARTEVTKTLTGAYTEEWGRDIMVISIKGTTGYKKRYSLEGEETDGFQAFKSLRNDVYRYFLEPDGTIKQFNKTDVYEMKFFNWGDGEYFVVMPRKFTLHRSKSQPLLYSYDLTFFCLKSIGATGNVVAPVTPPPPTGAAIGSVRTTITSATSEVSRLIGLS